MKVGLLHPGAMGTSIGAALKTAAADGGRPVNVVWAGRGRSAATRARATEHGFEDAGDLGAVAATCDVILSVCPPHAAEDLAAAVAATGFGGAYIDANAIAPARSKRIGVGLAAAGIDYIDGGIIGPPAWPPARTWIYLSGPRAADFTDLLTAGPLTCAALGPRIGRASALKMCFAAYTKGTTALLTAILGAAEALDVREALLGQWAAMDMGLDDKGPREACAVTAKAWRFVGEMDEIAATFAAAGMPDGFHVAAREVYRRLAGFKDEAEQPDLDAVLAALSAGAHDRAA